MSKFDLNTIRFAIFCLMLAVTVSAQENAQPYKSGEKVVITTIYGDQHAGRLLFATDSLLVLWKSPEAYNRRELNELAKPLHFSEIDKIVVEKKGHFGKGAGRGFLIGGAAGAIGGAILGVFMGGIISEAGANDNEVSSFIVASTLGGMAAFGAASALVGGTIGAAKDMDDHFAVNGNIEIYKRIVPRLKRNAIFIYGPPPELQALVKQAAKPFSLPSTERQMPAKQKDGNLHPSSLEPAVQMSKPSSVFPVAKFHIGFDGGWSELNAGNDILDAFIASGFAGPNGELRESINYPVENNPPLDYWNLEAEYGLTGRLRLGLAMGGIKPPDIVWDDGAVERVDRTSISLLLDYVFIPVDPLLLTRWEFAAGAGLSYNSLSVEGALGQFRPSASHFTVKESAIGGHLRARLDYYISRKLSMQLKIDGFVMPAVNVPETKYKTLTLKSHSVNFSGGALSLGARLHF